MFTRKTTTIGCIVCVLILLGAALSCARAAAEPPLALHLVAQPESGGKLLLGWESEDGHTVVPEALATVEDIAGLELIKDPSRGTTISVQLKSDAAQRLKEVTEKHLGGQIAIVIEGKVLAAPVIKQPIPGGRVSLSAPTEEETQRIYQMLESVLQQSGAEAITVYR